MSQEGEEDLGAVEYTAHSESAAPTQPQASDSAAAPPQRRGRWQRTVQAFSAAALHEPDSTPREAQQDVDRNRTMMYNQVLSKGSGPNYYPDVPRMSEDLTPPDQEHLAGHAGPKVKRTPGKGLMSMYRDLGVDAAADALYPGYNVASSGERTPWASPLEDLNGYMSAAGLHGYPGAPSTQGPPQQPQVVVHMSKAEAWARFTAYEACIQVCCSQPTNEHSQQFQAGGFRLLRDHLGIGGLLLNPSPLDSQDTTASAPSALAPEMCWVDSSAVRALQVPETLEDDLGQGLLGDVTVRVRVSGLVLPGSNVLDRVLRWAGGKKNAPDAKRGSGRDKLVVYVTRPDHSPLLSCPLDSHGQPLMTGASSWTPLDLATGTLHVAVHSRQGLVVESVVSVEALMQTAQSLEAQEDTDPANTPEALDPMLPALHTPLQRIIGTLNIPLAAAGGAGGAERVAAGHLVFEVQRVKRAQPEVEVAAVAAEASEKGVGSSGFGMLDSDLGMTVIGNTGDQMMRMNRNIAYDCLLSAALEVERCGPTRLTMDGPWQWLLTAYADHYGVSNAYRVLVHLQWILQPHIARTSQLCLSTICDSWTYLVAAKHKGELTAHEDTMLTRIRRDVEELLKVAFIRYYVPQQPDGSVEDTPAREFELQSWEAQHLQAAVLLYHELAPYLQPSARDWLAQCWQTAAQKRWRALLAMGDPDRILSAHDDPKAGEPSGVLAQGLPWRKNQPAASTMKQAGEAKVYQLVATLCKLIQEDITFDLNLKHEPGLLPPEPDLPRKTAEEYCAQFLQILRRVLDTHPPSLPTPQAVDLLANVAKMQRYLDVAGLQCDVQHPGHLNAFQLFQPHTLRWISASQQRLASQCSQLEAMAKAQGPNMMIGPSNSSALVATMMKAVSSELKCYEQVLKHWPRFAPALEASVCQVMRSVLAALSRQCEMATGNAQHAAATVATGGTAYRNAWHAAAAQLAAASKAAATPAPPPTAGANKANIPGLNSAHKRATSTLDATPSPSDLGPLAARRGPNPGHARVASAMPQTQGGWDFLTTAVRQRMAAAQGTRGGAVAVATVTMPASTSPPGGGGGAAMAAAAKAAGLPTAASLHPSLRVVVLMKEAVLLNSLKHIMVLVPELEDDLTKWATWSAGQQAALSSEGQLLPDGVDIGVHFAQLVKELRSGYAEAVATCAGRMAEVLRGNSTTNIRVALEPSRSLMDPVTGMSSAAAQKHALEEAMAPVLSGLQEALSALRAALDTRVCVATGRALWDYIGKDLHLFVSALHERSEDAGSGLNTAWRARQNADVAAHRIDETFRQTFTEMLNGAVQACDLAPPAHMDKVHKLLQRNNAVINMAFIPF